MSEEKNREISFRIRKAVKKDVDEIMEIMTAMPASVPDPAWFSTGDRAWVEARVEADEEAVGSAFVKSGLEGNSAREKGNVTGGPVSTDNKVEESSLPRKGDGAAGGFHGFTLLAVADEENGPVIAGFFIVDFPGLSEENLGWDTHFPQEQLPLVAHMDYAAVRPEYRGHHLQSRLVEAAEKELEHYPHIHLFCTIHPKNHASLHTMERHGYRVLETKEKYGGLIRHILYKRKGSQSGQYGKGSEESQDRRNGQGIEDRKDSQRSQDRKDRPVVLVSACLLGVHSRYNGKGVLDENIVALMDRAQLIPVCPEILGGLATPRDPAERVGDRLLTINGADVTAQYEKGAEETLALARLYGCVCAILKERSPACGSGKIYDGTHTGTLVSGDGVAAGRLKAAGIPVFGESEVEKINDFINKIL